MELYLLAAAPQILSTPVILKGHQNRWSGLQWVDVCGENEVKGFYCELHQSGCARSPQLGFFSSRLGSNPKLSCLDC